MIINLTGGTGTVSPMNYSVTGGLTEPAAPGENTIWVLTENGVEEMGSHAELLRKGGLYAKLYAMYTTEGANP